MRNQSAIKTVDSYTKSVQFVYSPCIQVSEKIIHLQFLAPKKQKTTTTKKKTQATRQRNNTSDKTTKDPYIISNYNLKYPVRSNFTIF